MHSGSGVSAPLKIDLFWKSLAPEKARGQKAERIAEKERREAAKRAKEIKKEEKVLEKKRAGRPRKPQGCEKIYLIDIGMD